MLEPFQLPFVQRGLFEVLALSIGAGVLGTWIVLRGLAFFSHAVGTATFPGLVLADGIGFSPALGAFGVAVAFTFSVWGLARRRGSAYDSLTALVLVGCLAAGVILASDVYHSGSNVEQLLFGSLLLVDGADIRLAIVAAAAVLLANVLFGHRWVATGFDEVGGPASGEGWLDVVLLALIALATTAALSVIGALLVAALFVAPAATVRLFANRVTSWQIGTVLLAAGEGTVGLWLSVKTNAPPGATIATLSGVVFGMAAIVKSVGPSRLGMASAAALVTALLIAGCGGSGSDSGKVSVVATTTQIGDFAREVGGNAVDVHQILAPNTDPHDYEPRPDDVTSTADAQNHLHQRRQPRRLDGQGRRRQRQRCQGGGPGRRRPREAPRGVERPGGIPLRPALVARSRGTSRPPFARSPHSSRHSPRRTGGLSRPTPPATRRS